MRVAYFPDSFHEVNGVAHTSRQFQAFAVQRRLPFLCVRAANHHPGLLKPSLVKEHQLWILELPRGRFSFHLDKDLRLDPTLLRYLPHVIRTVRDFCPDVIHITGPSEIGLIGATAAYHLGLPLVASWHTNVHHYAATRARWITARLPTTLRNAAERGIEAFSLGLFTWFYGHAQLLFAPNPGLCNLLERHANRPCRLMQRGVDTALFDPAHRDRPATDTTLILGFVGRLSVEKNVALLATIHQQLRARGLVSFRFLILGQGAEEAWLRQHLPNADFPGVLRGPDLAIAYANMDILVFPSHTDTFGNAVLEALASGVPAIVTPTGGPASIVRDGHTGFIRPDTAFADAILQLASDPALLTRMRAAARAHALCTSWDAVFDKLSADYESAIDATPLQLSAPYPVPL